MAASATIQQGFQAFTVEESSLKALRTSLVTAGKAAAVRGKTLSIEMVKDYDFRRRNFASRLRAYAERVVMEAHQTIDTQAIEDAARAALPPLPNEIVPASEQTRGAPVAGLGLIFLAPLAAGAGAAATPVVSAWVSAAIVAAVGAAILYVVVEWAGTARLNAENAAISAQQAAEYAARWRTIFDAQIAAGATPEEAKQRADIGVGPAPTKAPEQKPLLQQIEELAPWVIGAYVLVMFAPPILRAFDRRPAAGST